MSLDRAHDERGQAADLQALRQRFDGRRAGKTHATLQSSDTWLQPHERVHAHALQSNGLFLPHIEQRREIALQRGIDGRHLLPNAPAIAAREHAGHDAARRHAGHVAAEVTARAHPRKVGNGVAAHLAGTA